MFDKSPKELYEFADAHFGTRTAQVLAYLGVVAFACLALGIIGAFVVGLNTWIIQPVLLNIPAFNLTPYQVPLLSLGTTIVLLTLSGFLFVRYFQRWQNRTFTGLDSILESQSKELILELKELKSRVVNLELLTDAKNRDALVEMLVRREMANRLHVVSARCFVGDNSQNVTEPLRMAVIDGKRLEFTVERKALQFEDRTGAPMQLEVVYTIGDNVRETITVTEHQRLRIPPPVAGSIGDIGTRR